MKLGGRKTAATGWHSCQGTVRKEMLIDSHFLPKALVKSVTLTLQNYVLATGKAQVCYSC